MIPLSKKEQSEFTEMSNLLNMSKTRAGFSCISFCIIKKKSKIINDSF